ncbi:MAG: PAS domain S-box protein [Bacteroidota bacterium]
MKTTQKTSTTAKPKETAPDVKLEQSKKQKAKLKVDLKKMTKTLEAGQAMQQELEQAVGSVVTIKSDKIFTFYSKAAERMFGYSREEVLGQNIKMIVPIEHRGNHDQYVEANMTTGEDKVVGKGRDLEMIMFIWFYVCPLLSILYFKPTIGKRGLYIEKNVNT